MILRVILGSLSAGFIEYFLMRTHTDVSDMLDGLMVSLVFIVAVTTSLLPELRRNIKIKNAHDKLDRRYRELLNATSRDSSVNLNNIMFDNMDDAVIITDSSNNIVATNPSFERITGFSFDDVVGQCPSMLKSGETPIGTYKEMRASLKNYNKWEGILIDKRKDGARYSKFIKIYAVKEEGVIVNHIGIFFDADKKEQLSQRYMRLAMYDELTGIPNRNLFVDRVETLLSHIKRTKELVSVFFIDLDDFKNINDVYGHKYGDVVLKEAAKRIQDCVRESDTVSRFGGDEFSVILRNINNRLDAGAIAGKIIMEVERPIYVDNFCFKVSCSIGVALSNEDGDSSKEILQNADIAMYKAKELGKGKFEFFNDSLRAAFQKKVKLETDITAAIENKELTVLFQPQIDCNTGKVVGAESLVRWVRDGDVISPIDFIPAAENSGLIIDIDKYVFNKAVNYIDTHFNELFDSIGYRFPISVNFSSSTVRCLSTDENNFVHDAIIDSEHHSFSDIEIEITETTLMKSKIQSIASINQLKKLGVRVAIDDFGTGHSSLAYIHSLPITKIKIDKTFVDRLIVKEGEEIDEKAIDIISFIKVLAGSIGVSTIAEGVETREQKEIICKMGIDSIQGYYYSRPLDIHTFCSFVSERGNSFKSKKEDKVE